MASWSTETVNARERFSFWREVVCKSLFNVSTEVPPEHFTGFMKVRVSGPFRFLTSGSSSYEFVRSQRNISSAPADYCTILMQLRGQTAIAQDNDTFTVQPRDIAIFDSRAPFSAQNSEDGRRLVAIVPRTMIYSRAPILGRRPLYRLDSNSRFLGLARRHLMQLVSDDLNENETNLLTENLCNLLALANSADIAPAHLRPELQIAAMLAFCRQHMHDPRLSPQLLAEHFGISVRTLHSRFVTFGQTFGRWLLETRLDACHKALRDPRQWDRGISEIAYSCGFIDISHFNKSFRTRFGMSPSEWRFELSINPQ